MNKTGPKPRHEQTPVGRQVREARLAAGYLTSKAAAEAAGVLPAKMSKLETSAIQPTFAVLRRVIVGAGLHLERFFPPDVILAAAERIRANGPAE